MSIIVKMVGGLGNQLFQYAFARAISSRLKTDFLLDIAAYREELRYWPKGTLIPEYYLHNFKPEIHFAKARNMMGFVWLRRHYSFFDYIYGHLKHKGFSIPFYYREKMFAFDSSALSQKDSVYFDGFWQTEKYFKDIGDELRKELTLKNPLSPYSQGISDEIQKTNAVSLHVRRTVFVSDPAISSFHGACSIDYYKKAIDYITKNVPSPHFFIFSDDYEWSAENFKWLPHPYTCVKNGVDKNYEDIILMSRCKNHIIANSSFSWWGAWFNPNKDKIVIAPKKWFANAPKNNTIDLLPEEWVKM